MSRQTLKRSELVKRLSARFPMLLAIDVRIAVDEIVEAISGAVVNGQRVEVRGFGAFTLRERRARICRNPKTGEVFPVETRYSPHFKAAMKLRLKVMKLPVSAPLRLRRPARPRPDQAAAPVRREEFANAA
jgi:integration host factor subunit beta